MTDAVRARRPGGRSARTRTAVHDAVRSLVHEVGREQMSVAGIAARAGVDPATVYRRWGSLEALVLEVAVDELNESSEVSSTGDLRADLEAYGHGILRALHGPGDELRFLSAITAAASSADTELGDVAVLVRRRLDRIAVMLSVSDPEGVLTSLDVVDGMVGPLYFRALTGGRRAVTADDVVRLADNLVAVSHHRRRSGTWFPAVYPQ